jgi:Raf kinase inhibitor-like YbhB/YbcL family protein
MRLTSTAFEAGEKIPARHTCDARDDSPRLAWSGVPAETASFALIMDDPDAPPGTWVHWVVYALPGASRELAEGLPKEPTLDGGAKQGACWGVESFRRVGYHGPCPPPGPAHRYSFRLYALDAELDLPARATKETLVEAMQGHILAQAELIGLYGR